MATPDAGADRGARTRGAWHAVILAWAVFARLGGLLGPFGSGWQHLGALYAIVARNFLRYGFVATRFAQVENPAPAPRSEWVWYTHHPPAMGWTTAGMLALVGDGALAVKLPGLLFSLLQIVVTYGLVARALSRRAGLAAAFATAVLPAGAVYATHGSDLGPQSIGLALLTLWLDQRERARNPARPRLWPVLLGALAAVLFDWPVLLVVGALALRSACERQWRRAALLAAFAPAVLALHLLHTWLATGSFGGGNGESLIASALQHGVEGATSFLGDVSSSSIWRRVEHHLRFLFTLPGLLLAAGGLAAWLLTWLAPVRAWTWCAALRERGARWLFVELAILGVGYCTLFPRAVVVHRFWMIVALPFVALLLGTVVEVAGRTRMRQFVGCAAFVALGVFATLETRRAQEEERTPIYAELGAMLREFTPPDTPVLTTQRPSHCLEFYAERVLVGDLSDDVLATFLAGGGAALPTSGFFALPEPSLDPPPDEAHDRKLLAFLRERYSVTDIQLPQSRATLHLYDFSHPLPRK